MKKRIAILLLSALIFNASAYYLFFPLLIGSFKERFRNEKKEKIVTHIITADENNSHKIKFVDRKEFIFEGKLFDILDKKIENGKITYYCYHDKEEEKAADNHKEREKKRNTVNSSGVFSLALITNQALIHFPVKSINGYFFITPSFVSCQKEIIVPPPNA